MGHSQEWLCYGGLTRAAGVDYTSVFLWLCVWAICSEE
jgi:hypothetical protein